MIDLKTLPTPNLVALIAAAVQELAARTDLPEPLPSVPAVPVAAAPQQQIPPDDDRDFVLMIKAQVKRGTYIKAGERQRVAAIGVQYPVWVRSQGLPLDAGTGSWKAASQYHSAPRAPERPLRR
jgi:hypothetical protein